MGHRDDVKTVVINGLRYPLAAVVERSQLGIFDRKFIVGDAQYDSDSYQSALILSNLSGGIGIEDSDEGADTTRFWFGIMATDSPRMIGLPPLVSSPTAPQSGACRPLGVIGTQFYAAFDDDAYGWDDSSDDWYSTANALTYAPVNKPVAFDGRVWIPQGANGIRAVTETTANTGTLTVALNTATPKAVSLAIWNNNLYALCIDGTTYKLVQGDTTWTQVGDSGGNFLILNTSETPKNLVTYFDRQGEPTLWCISNRAAYMYYESANEWRQSNIVFPPHPDFGRSACIWRTGEDLWIAAGMDIVRQTTGNAIVPLASGLSRDQGVPQEYRGAIVDLCPEISRLYALVSPGTARAHAYSSKFGSDGTGDGELDTPGQVAVDSSGNIFVVDSGNDRIQKFDSAGSYSAKVGTTGTGNSNFDGPTGVCVDSSGNVYVLDIGNAKLKKFNSSLAFVAQVSGVGNGAPTSGTPHIVTDDTYLYYSTGTHILRMPVDLSTFIQLDGFSLSNPTGIALSADGGTVYVADTGNDRIVALAAGTASQTAPVRSWGFSGTDDGQFSNPVAVAVSPVTGNVFVADTGRDDVQEFTPVGLFVRKIGSSGTGNGQFASCGGLAFDSSGNLYASDTQSGDDRIQKFTVQDVEGYPSLMAWPGTGWHGLWRGSAGIDPTWAMVSAPTTHYRLWWGDTDGGAYYRDLFRGFENPNQARLAGTATFASEGFLLTSKFDAGMLGFPKVASHVVAIPLLDTITDDETFTIEFSIDDGGWESLGTVSASTLGTDSDVHLSFGSAGRVFNTIRFRVSGSRGSVDSLSPFLRSLTFLFVKVPQKARSFIFTITLPPDDIGRWGRTGQTMMGEIDDLADAQTFFDVSYNGQTISHCRFAGATGHDNVTDQGGQRTVSIIELPTG